MKQTMFIRNVDFSRIQLEIKFLYKIILVLGATILENCRRHKIRKIVEITLCKNRTAIVK